jgi:hypothetical protein
MATIGYPKNLDLTITVYSHGGVRIYPVSRDQAEEITKEFPKAFKFRLAPSFEGERLFYMNINHGEQHVIFSINDKTQT